jgi:hypothetical protein
MRTDVTAGCDLTNAVASRRIWVYCRPVWGDTAVIAMPAARAWLMSSGTRWPGARVVIAAAPTLAAWHTEA